MRRQAASLDFEGIEAVVHNEVGQTIDALSGNLLEEPLECLHQVDQGHPIQSPEVTIDHGLITVSLVQCSFEIGPEFARARDPQTGDVYVLVQAEQYEKIRKIIDGVSRRSGWDEPAMEKYESYRKKKAGLTVEKSASNAPAQTG